MEKNRLKKLIIPLVLEQLLNVSVGFIDTFMVSKVGEAAVSGVAIVDTLNILVIQIMAALAAGGVVVISQYIGDKNRDMVQSACRHLEMLVMIFAVAVTGAFLIFGRSFLKVLFGNVEADVMAAAVTYMLVTSVSFAFWGLYSSGASILRCHEDTKTAMKISMFMNILNMLLNAYYVFILKIGVLGVAIATLISRAVAGIVMKFILNSFQKEVFGKSTYRFSPDSEMVKRILSMGIPSGIENGMFHVGKLVLTSVIATLGTAMIAANSISYQIVEFPSIPGNTIGLALVIIVGQDIGANNKKQAISDTKYLLKLAYYCEWICCIALFFLAPFIVSLFSLSKEACDSAVMVLRCFSIVSLFIWPLSYTLPNALKGAGDVKFSMVISIIAMWFGRVLTSYCLVKYFSLGILGIWIGMFADWVIRSIGYMYRFISGVWLDKKIV